MTKLFQVPSGSDQTNPNAFGFRVLKFIRMCNEISVECAHIAAHLFAILMPAVRILQLITFEKIKLAQKRNSSHL